MMIIPDGTGLSGEKTTDSDKERQFLVPLQSWFRSSMDRMSDSGSDDGGSNPFGITVSETERVRETAKIPWKQNAPPIR